MLAYIQCCPMDEPVYGAMYLKPSRVGRGRGHDRRVLQRALLLQRAPDAGDRRRLLADGDVDAADLLVRVAGLPVGALVDDRVERDRGLAGLAVADDQLALAAADRRHGVDRLDAGLERLLHGLPGHDVRRLELELAEALALDRAAVVDRLAERVHHAAQVGVAHRNREDAAGPLDLLALLDAGEVTQDNGADLADVEVQGDTQRAVGEFKQFVRHGRGQTLDVRDPVARIGDDADLLTGDLGRVGRDVAL
nr:hypothetical protein GCM10020092_015560 [Actinoplanes digitatis]